MLLDSFPSIWKVLYTIGFALTWISKIGFLNWCRYMFYVTFVLRSEKEAGFGEVLFLDIVPHSGLGQYTLYWFDFILPTT